MSVESVLNQVRDSGRHTAPSVAIIVRVMDRASEMRVSLPSLLSQDYDAYSVVIVDHSSEDDLPDVLATFAHPRLRVVRCPRPAYFNRSRAANIGVRYSTSDLVFFLDSGMAFKDQHQLSEIVAAFESSSESEPDHYARWRQVCGLPPLTGTPPANRRQVYCECECHGLHLLVARDVFQRIGGLNEALHDWGYEDTDLSTRLELSGYARIPIRGLLESTHHDDLRVRFHREDSKQRSWERNRRISDGLITTFGPVLRTQALPGWCDRIELDGVAYSEADAPQQTWVMPTASQWYPPRHATGGGTVPGEVMPVVSVVVPTRNAAEYLALVLDSILSQDYPHIECIVVDGGSTDATPQILASYGARIRWTSKSDRGAFDAINRGWLTSRGELLAWLNADDGWTPGAVSAAVNYFRENPSVALIHGDCLIVDGDGRIIERRTPPEWDLSYAIETCHHMIDQPAAFVRREIVQRIGWLYPAWFHDWDLWRRISVAGGTIRRVPHLLGYARVRRDNSQYRHDILVGGLVELTKRFFTLPALPPDVYALRSRALSSCYLRVVQTLRYGRPESRRLQFTLRVKALMADPSNFRNVMRVSPEGGRSLPISHA